MLKLLSPVIDAGQIKAFDSGGQKAADSFVANARMRALSTDKPTQMANRFSLNAK